MGIASGTEIAPVDREAWLAERRQGIGASEAAAALGLSPFETPLGLWARKLGLQPEPAESEAMRWGSRLEPLIAEEYERRTGLALVRRQVFLKDRIDDTPVSATLDAVNEARLPVELKTLSAFKAGTLGAELSDELPDHWLVQAHVQMVLAGARRCHFAVLVGGQRFLLFDVARDEAVVAGLFARLADFWRCVQTRSAPPAVAADVPLLAALYPEAEGEVELGAEASPIAENYQQLGQKIREGQEARDYLKAKLLEALGDAAVGLLPDGRRVKRAVIDHPEATRTVRAYREVRLTIGKGKERP